MKKEIKKALSDFEGKWKMYGVKDYVQLFIEAGYDICLNKFYNYEIDAEITVSTVHTEDLGWCTLIEFCK